MPVDIDYVLYQSHNFITTYLTAIYQENVVYQLTYKNLAVLLQYF